MNDRPRDSVFVTCSTMLYVALLALAFTALSDAWQQSLAWYHWPCPSLVALLMTSCLNDWFGNVAKARERRIERRRRRFDWP